ncbi:MAG: ABC-2 family transporter protein, partial [Burkholderiales bacterium]|nr:ABC-2 family transporter protein [Burkholderiales bacterium]
MESFARDDGFAHDLALLHAPQDLRAAQALGRALQAQGASLAWVPGEPPPGGRLDDQLARARWVLLLWSSAMAEWPEQLDRARLALQRRALMPLRLDASDLPPGLDRVPVVGLAGWNGDPGEPVFSTLLRAIAPLVLPPASGAPAPLDSVSASAPTERRRWWQWWRREEPRAPVPHSSLREVLGQGDEPFERTVPLTRLTPLPSDESSQEVAPRRVDPAPQRDDGLPVWVGAAAPRHAAPGQHFALRLGLFTEPMREHMLAVLAHLAEEAELAPRPQAPGSVWRAGAPVTVAVRYRKRRSDGAREPGGVGACFGGTRVSTVPGPVPARTGRRSAPPFMGKYRHVLSIGIQSTLVYRVNFVVRALFGLVPLLALILLWRAIYEGRTDPSVGGYSLAEVVTYYLVVNVVVALTAVTEDDWQIAADIRDGRISQFLLKPIDYLAYRLCLFAAGRLVYTAAALIPTGLFLFMQREHLLAPASGLHLAAFGVSLVLTALLQFFVSFTMALLAFWVLEVATFIFILFAFEYVAGGHLFPLDLLPPVLQTVLGYTPFPYMLFFPVHVYLGRVEGWELARGLGVQALW